MSFGLTALTAQERVRPLLQASVARQVFAVLFGSLLLTLSSWISVPMFPVPMTMQTFAVLLIGAVFGWRLAGITVMVWLAQGAMGLPVFAGGAGGFARIMGPTGGFLMAFPIAAIVTGWLMERQGFVRTLVGGFAVMLLGHALIFAGGVSWLAMAVGLDKAIAVGFVPFILGSVVKSALVVAALEAMRVHRKG
jgi:biotin transport system substrate-specific component